MIIWLTRLSGFLDFFAGGWQAFRETNRLQSWNYKRVLVLLQAKYGIFPYYRVSVENGYSNPHDYVITLDEGEVGLPDKYFYGNDADEEVVRGYKMLLRDFAINMGEFRWVFLVFLLNIK